MKTRDEKGRFVKGYTLPLESEMKRRESIRRKWSDPEYIKRMSEKLVGKS